MNVSDIPHTTRANLVMIASECEVTKAARLLTSGPDILVVHDGEGVLQGVVTRTDIVRQMGMCQGGACRGAVSVVMSRDVMVCHEGDDLHALSGQMKAAHIKNVPIVDAMDRPVGLLTARIILRTLLDDAEQAEAQLVAYLSGGGYQ